MTLQSLTANAHKALLSQLEEQLSECITAEIGTGWTLSGLKDRIQCYRPADSIMDTFTLDGRKILEVGPIKCDSKVVDGVPTVTFNIPYRKLV
jgi:hypothetical protein